MDLLSSEFFSEQFIHLSMTLKQRLALEELRDTHDIEAAATTSTDIHDLKDFAV
jgi:hypothetical protein